MLGASLRNLTCKVVVCANKCRNMLFYIFFSITDLGKASFEHCYGLCYIIVGIIFIYNNHLQKELDISG